MPSTAANEVAAGWPELVAGIADVTPATSVGAPGLLVWVTTEGLGVARAASPDHGRARRQAI